MVVVWLYSGGVVVWCWCGYVVVVWLCVGGVVVWCYRGSVVVVVVASRWCCFGLVSSVKILS